MAARPSRNDVLLVLGFVALGQAEVWAFLPSEWRGLMAVAVLAAGMAMAWRRLWPSASCLAVLGIITYCSWLALGEGIWQVIALVIVMFSVARHASTPRALLLLGGALAYCGLTALWGGAVELDQLLANLVFVGVLMVAVPWAAGFTLRRRERLSRANAAVAVAEERSRIARELHDVVTHSLSVIAIQASATLVTMPEGTQGAARETLETIENTSHEALAEMRRLLRVMREPDVEAAVPHTLAEIEGVLDVVRRAGWSSRLRVEGEPVALSAGLNLAAYRIVQEAMTNALRHSHGTHAEVTLRYLADRLQVEVVDGPSPARPTQAGFGLEGMNERASHHGGSVETRHTEEGGFIVAAELPYAAKSTEPVEVVRARPIPSGAPEPPSAPGP